MKKICILFLLALLPMVANAETVEIDGIYYNLIYNSKVQIAEVTYGPMTMDDHFGFRVVQDTYTGDIVIPEFVSYEGILYNVTSIYGGEAHYMGEGQYNYVGAFSGCKNLTSITIPSSITAIGRGAFQDCNNLTKVIISDLEAWCKIQFTSELDTNPLYYAEHLYMNGKEIKDLVLPNSLTSISDYAFCHCSGLTSVTIPNSVTSIGSGAFYFCSGLTSITISNSVSTIENYAFTGCSNLNYVSIPNSVTSIGKSAFAGCSSLSAITIGSGVTGIGGNAFGGCNCLSSVKVHIIDYAAFCNNRVVGLIQSLIGKPVQLINSVGEEIKNYNIPEGVNSIGSSAFQNCSGLTSVTISNGVSSIGQSAFSSCTGLTSITIPNSVSSIGQSAFSGCSGLTSITIPHSVTSIGNSAFYGCNSLQKVIVQNIAAWFSISFGNIDSNPLYYAHHLYSDEETEIKNIVIPIGVTSIRASEFQGCSGLTSVTIPNSVTSIGNSAFSGCSGLTSVTIPNSVTIIGNNVFSGCSGLTSVTIPNSVASISSSAFKDCTGLSSVTIPNSVTSIGSSSFYGCNGLTSVTIGSGIKTISENAFALCPELTDFYCYAENVPSTNSTAFKDSYIEYATLHVPDVSINLYKQETPWNTFKEIVPITVRTYILTYMVDDEVYKTYEMDYGTAITPEPEPTKEGYIFSGWSQIPATMPAYDVTVTGTFTKILETCATPTISYTNGKLKFNCETEDVSYIYEITDSDIKIGYDTEVDLTVTYNITVYATKDGYQDSEAATATLCWIDVEPQTEGIIDEDAIAEVKAMPVMIQSQGSTITIQGAAEGTPIAIYDIEGKQYGSAIAGKVHATIIATSLRPGSVAIVKIGEKLVKVRI